MMCSASFSLLVSPQDESDVQIWSMLVIIMMMMVMLVLRIKMIMNNDEFH